MVAYGLLKLRGRTRVLRSCESGNRVRMYIVLHARIYKPHQTHNAFERTPNHAEHHFCVLSEFVASGQRRIVGEVKATKERSFSVIEQTDEVRTAWAGRVLSATLHRPSEMSLLRVTTTAGPVPPLPILILLSPGAPACTRNYTATHLSVSSARASPRPFFVDSFGYQHPACCSRLPWRARECTARATRRRR